MNAIRNVIAKRKYARDAKVLERPALSRLSSVSRRLLEEAQSQARALDDNHVEPEHILLGVIRESEQWEAAGISGPHHLRAAAEAAGTTLAAIEQNLIHRDG